jgi:para-aminobenzoate synthetase/4-amino-4-deoxychorismate lyase
MGVRCRFDDLVVGRAFELVDPTRILVADSLPEVPMVLGEVDDVLRAGGIVAGFVAYDAAPAFDRALTVRPPADVDHPLPLAWFGVFGGRVEVPTVPPPDCPPIGPWAWSVSEGAYGEAFAAVQEEIASGWTYQVNLAVQLTAELAGDPMALYRQLVHAQRGAHHGYVETDAFAIACGSPELFFAVHDGMVTTRPMKGTAPRGRYPEEDAVLAEALLSSEKERAENVMIVDLLRNDLGRIAPYGAVAATSLCVLEAYPTVWQLTSVVEAMVGEISLSRVFGALFPCGSVTGAPKASTMAIIARLEERSRGVFCGALGWAAGDQGTLEASFAVPIRTAVVDRESGRGSYGVGSGVTVGSSVAGEWGELASKAQVLAEPLPPSGLLETLRFEPGRGLVNVERHLDRLAASAERLGFRFDRGAIDAAIDGTGRLGTVARTRIVLGRAGEVTVEIDPLPEPSDVPVRLGIARQPVDRHDHRLFHKTTDRARYDRQLEGRSDAVDDVILWNREGEVTETTRANLLVEFDGRWWTPTLSCGLLPGVGRSVLLDRGVVTERVITVDDLWRADRLEVVSSLRGRRAAHLVGAGNANEAPSRGVVMGVRS